MINQGIGKASEGELKRLDIWLKSDEANITDITADTNTYRDALLIKTDINFYSCVLHCLLFVLHNKIWPIY